MSATRVNHHYKNNDLVVDINTPELITTKIAAPIISDPTIEEVMNIAPSLDDSESPSDISTFFL
jgi:hypothetical protein